MLKSNSGFTLIEVLATLLIFTLLFSVLFAFSTGVQRGAARTTRAAYSGQAVESALTILRHELAGALDLEIHGETLHYKRVQDGLVWEMKIEERKLLRSNEGNVALLAKNLDSFYVVLPSEGDQIVTVTVASGQFELSDKIYLRNSQEYIPGAPDPDPDPGPNPDPDPDPDPDPPLYPQWSAFTTYPDKTYVTYQGRIFQTRWNNVSGVCPLPLSTWGAWREISENWVENNTYNAGDVVWYLGTQYQAKQENVVLPTVNWAWKKLN